MRFTDGLVTFTKAVVFLTLSAASIQASAVIYNFVGTGAAFSTFPAEPVAFQLTAPAFVTSVGSGFGGFSCSSLDSSTNCGSGIPSVFFSNNTGSFSAQISFDAANNVGYAFYFPTGAFGAPGVYSAGIPSGSTFNPGTLTVTQTPEPSTMLLALSGFCLCGLIRLLIKRSTAS